MDLARSIAVAAAHTNAVVQAVNPECFHDATPCSEYDVRTLAEHIAGFAALSTAAARKESFRPEVFDPDGWQSRYAAAVRDLTAAWSEEGALEGSTSFGRSDLPAERAAAITLQELVIHGWDLAVATGQDFEPEPEVAAAVRTIVEAGAARAREAGAFGPAVPVPAEAGDFPSALGTSGRDPAWSTG